MKILYYDCFMGISGDMNLAALIDLGVDVKYLLAELKKIHLHDYKIHVQKSMKNGISGTQVRVELTHEQHEHHHSHLLVQKQHAHAPHRGFTDIKKLIEESSLSENVKKRSIAMFRLIGEAEAKIHAKTLDDIHFHEVGAVDSIVDIVGAAICLEFLKPDKIISSPIQLGGGMVKCAHGNFPVPAPATSAILKGIPVRQGAVNFETTTPTGAAILAANVSEFTNVSAFSIEKIGYGLGHKDADIPNVLRVYWANSEEVLSQSPYLNDKQMMIETNIDDMPGEYFEHVMNLLFDAGAADVTLTPMIMKKSRPGIILSVICQHHLLDTITDIILRNTSSIGVRTYEVNRQIMERSGKELDTPWGKVKFKFCGVKGTVIKIKPEYDDCVRIAKEKNISLNQVIFELNKIANQYVSL